MSARPAAEWEQRPNKVKRAKKNRKTSWRTSGLRPGSDQGYDPRRKCGSALPAHASGDLQVPEVRGCDFDRPKGFMCENRICGFALWKTGGILTGAGILDPAMWALVEGLCS